MNLKKFALCIILPMIIMNAQAQYLGPNAQVINTVAEVLKNPMDDHPVVLEGYLLKKLSKKKYLFADTTGEIQVEINKKKFTTPITEKTKVRLIGEIEAEHNKNIEIDVDRVEIMTENASK